MIMRMMRRIIRPGRRPIGRVTGEGAGVKGDLDGEERRVYWSKDQVWRET